MAQQQGNQKQPQPDQKQFRGDGADKGKRKNPEQEDTLPPTSVDSDESNDEFEDDEADRGSRRTT